MLISVMSVFRRYSAGANEQKSADSLGERGVCARVRMRAHSIVIVCIMHTRAIILFLSAVDRGCRFALERRDFSRYSAVALIIRSRRSNCFAKLLRCIKVMDARWTIAGISQMWIIAIPLMRACIEPGIVIFRYLRNSAQA